MAGKWPRRQTDSFEWSRFVFKVCLIGRLMSATVWFKETPFGHELCPCRRWAQLGWTATNQEAWCRHLAGCFGLVTGTWQRNTRQEGLIFHSPSEAQSLVSCLHVSGPGVVQSIAGTRNKSLKKGPGRRCTVQIRTHETPFLHIDPSI